MASENTKITVLKARRGVIKGRITRIMKFLREFPADGDPSTILARKEKVETSWDEFQEIQYAMECQTEEPAAEEKYRAEFEDLYFEVMAECNKMLTEVGNKENKNSDSKIPKSSTNSHQASVVKLAALNVPEFSGNYKEWTTFKDVFGALIHSNEALTKVQKLIYLKAALSGDAAEVVKCLETIANNCEVAWDCLNERYNNKRIIVQSHTKAIFELEGITEESSTKLRRFIDSLLGHIKALEVIGYKPLSWGPMLLHIISTKLDNATLREWETQASKTEVPEVDELITFLKHRFQILESIENAQKKG